MSQSLSPIAGCTTTASTRTSVLLQVLLAGFLGAMLVAATGFSHIEAVHNAAHDARHSAGFPCH